jgi:hypothetical protein
MVIVGLSIGTILATTMLCSAGTIEVTGQAEVRYVPDYADVSFGVTVRQPAPRTAFGAARDTMAHVLTICKEMGIAERDVRTSQVSLKIAWKQVDQQSVFDGYNASLSVLVRVHDLKQVEPFTLRIIESGINEIDAVSFGNDASRRFRDEARLKALQAAREKALALANELDQDRSFKERSLSMSSRIAMAVRLKGGLFITRTAAN